MTKAELYQKACMLPLLPGVYIIRDKSDTIIYIGKAKRLRIRVSQYFREGVPHDNKVSQMIAHAYAFDVIVCQSEFEALVLEASQIKAHTPKYNILLKDDKGYSYIKVTKEPWPRLSFVLQKEEDDAEYIGPYTSSFAARQMAETAMDAFLLPRCNKRFPQEIGRGRPCLNAHIGKCMAVCSGKISCETYNQAVKNAVHLIRYGKKDILKTLNERMQEASDRLEFETAALLRDQIAAITKLTAGQKVVVDPDVEMDVVALAGTPDSVCAAVLRFREGRLTDKREFLFHDTSDIAAVREEFLPRYYLDDEQIPKIIAVDELPPDSDALQQALNEKRGSEVQLYVPQRGDKAHLVEMAHTNAVERLARESGRYAREEKLLDELAQVLGLAKPPRAIESYDISNWGDGSSVCGMVTFKDGKPFKAGYRKFKMKTVAGTDDYASLASLAALYQEQSLIFNTSYEDIFDSFYIASSAGLFPEEKRIDEDALRAFLQSTREMIDAQQITAQTNEYVMASGNGQSVAQSEFAMSLIKVAEGSYPCGTGVVSSRSDALKLFWSYPAVAIRPLPGSGFEAKEIVSIPANAANPTLAKAFVQIMLTDPVVQLNSLYKGFSVQRDVENAYLAQTIADGEQTYAADPLTCDWDSLIEELGAPSVSSATIYDVTHEAAFDYYGNEIDLDTAVQRIEENLGLYFSEQQ